MFDPGQPCLFHEKYSPRVVGLHMLDSIEIAVLSCFAQREGYSKGGLTGSAVVFADSAT